MDRLKTWIYRNRRHAKRLLVAAGRVFPVPLTRRLRALAEQVAYRVVPEYQGDTLPPIFGYWAGRHVQPCAERIGMPSPDALYYAEAKAVALRKGQVSIASIGSGACSLELSLLERLRGEGVDARMLCVDFNVALMEMALQAARARGLDEWFTVATLDCNRPFALERRDVIVVNQFFHHVEELETFAASLRDSLESEGVLLTSDVIGRNGHVLWPAVDVVVQEFWQRLPQDKRFDRYHSARRDRYVSVDHAAYSNEGVRAQDVVASLMAQFEFERFLTFGGAIMPFVERRIGFNFDPGSPEDRAFIDELAALDLARIEAGDYPASNMIAVLRHKGKAGARSFVPVSPEQHVASTRRQLALCRAAR
ncbi:methyltransferase [Luteimonas saliphila]|uniref:methyltransferase n=1 Tax=Luteimonas saliphila TaxID=2804919 RepID=UPI00192DFE27|nr:class I SAM-dependent methyltransferase [Luteimonas saliphila]